MQLEEFYDYKNQLMKDLLTTEPIVRLIDETVDLEHASALAYKNVFPYELIPETVEHGHTFVCFEVDIQKAANKTFYLPTLYIWVFTHKSKMRLEEGRGVRTDRLCSEICKKINGSREYGLGELDLYSVKRFSPMTAYNGKLLTFTATDFNRQYDGTKRVPTNRKVG